MRHRVKLPLLLASAALFTGLLPARAIAAPYRKLFVFGDSLSDTGNVFNASKQFLGTGAPPAPYYQGRFSNGPVWVDYLAEKLNLTPQPIAVLENPAGELPGSSTDSINFAYGGATTGTSSGVSAAVPGLQTQVAEFERIASQSADPEGLYVIWMGANDYLGSVDRSGAAGGLDPAVPVGNIARAIQALYQAGARHFLVANLPDLGETPLAKQQGSATVQTLSRLSDRHNQLLSQRLDELQRTLPDLDLLRLDIGELYVKTTDAQQFSDLITPCYDRATGTICAQPDRHLFWDNLHPTTAAHREISDSAFALIQQHSASPPAASLPLAGLSAIGTVGILAGVGAFWRYKRHQGRDRISR